MREMGTTDSGEPLHIVTFNPAQQFDFAKLSDKVVLLINNGIHAGEPDGIDATMMLFRDLALGKINVPKNTVVVAIPVYNIGGALNRNSTSRVNQEGPKNTVFVATLAISTSTAISSRPIPETPGALQPFFI
jgi:hypothetical protein